MFELLETLHWIFWVSNSPAQAQYARHLPPKSWTEKGSKARLVERVERVEFPSVEENLGTASHIVDILHHVTMYALSVFFALSLALETSFVLSLVTLVVSDCLCFAQALHFWDNTRSTAAGWDASDWPRLRWGTEHVRTKRKSYRTLKRNDYGNATAKHGSTLGQDFGPSKLGGLRWIFFVKMVASHDRLRRLHTATYRLEVRGPKWKLQMILADQVMCEVTPVICVPWLIRVTCMQRQNANMWSLQTWGFLCRNISCGLWHYWLFRMIPVVCVWLVCFVLAILLLRLLGASLQVLSGGLGRLLVVMRESQFGRMAESCAPKTTWDWPINAECHSQVAKQNNGNRLAAWDSNKEGGATDSKAETTPWLCLKKRVEVRWKNGWRTGISTDRALIYVEVCKDWNEQTMTSLLPRQMMSRVAHLGVHDSIPMHSITSNPSFCLRPWPLWSIVYPWWSIAPGSSLWATVQTKGAACTACTKKVGRAVQKNCAEAWSCLVFVDVHALVCDTSSWLFQDGRRVFTEMVQLKKKILGCARCAFIFAVVSTSTIMHHSCIIVCCCL